MYCAMGMTIVGNTLSYVHKPELTFTSQRYEAKPGQKDICDLRNLVLKDYVELDRTNFIPDLETAESISKINIYEKIGDKIKFPHAIYNFQKTKDFLFVDISGPHRNYKAIVFQFKNKNAYIEFEKKGFKLSELKLIVNELTKICPSLEDTFMNNFEDNEVLGE
tara:strand:+ start:248 stop:739 length:492 start_codon:yes stop_codon:yes gene_type:complete